MSRTCVLVAWLLAGLFAGCATAPAPTGLGTTGAGLVAPRADQHWQTVCFRMPFDDAGHPVWARDLVLADRVVAPALAAHAAEIPLWRFHRRAARDGAGHQFSLLVFADPGVHADLRRHIEASPLLAAWRTHGELREVTFECRAAQRSPEVAATSDPAWDPAIQRAWPHFIMGVSASWLALVHDLAQGVDAEADDLVAAYAKVDARITELWGAQGQHAFLHHLGAVYGYRPVRIQTWMNY
ncbi:MAG: hypothetical protein AB7N53_20160 [Candidatus Binatia bacterium]